MTEHPANDAGALLFGAIADDLTGGVELAAMLVARGVKTSFRCGPAADPGGGHSAEVIALKTRVAPVHEAVTRTLDAARDLQARGARQLFQKYCATFDSTAEGNIGPCAEALMQLTGAAQAIFCPALCENGRTVYQGHMFGGSQLLAESPKRLDPLTPMTDSNLVRVLQAQSVRRAGLLPYAVVDRGPDAILAHAAELKDAGVALLLVDTLKEEHLAHIARAALDMPLLTGNSSVAAHLPPLWFARGTVPEPSAATLAAVDGPGAVLVGSVAERSLAQLARFARTSPVLTIDLERAFGGDDVVAEAAAFARDAVRAGRLFAISTAAVPEEVAALQARHGRSETAAKAEGLLGQLARILVREVGVRRLIVAGGETSGAAVAALGIAELDVGPYEGPGVARTVAHGAEPLALLLKSGKLGGDDLFASMLGEMRRPLHREPAAAWPPAPRSDPTA